MKHQCQHRFHGRIFFFFKFYLNLFSVCILITKFHFHQFWWVALVSFLFTLASIHFSIMCIVCMLHIDRVCALDFCSTLGLALNFYFHCFAAVSLLSFYTLLASLSAPLSIRNNNNDRKVNGSKPKRAHPKWNAITFFWCLLACLCVCLLFFSIAFLLL